MFGPQFHLLPILPMTLPVTQHYITENRNQTYELGRRFALQLNAGDLVLLRGDLGAGKTTFVQGVAAGLGIGSAVTSPTFVLIMEHHGPLPLLHLDAYRLENLDEEALQDAGIYDFLSRDDAVKFVEWPQRIAAILPRPRFEISLETTAEDQRQITICQY
jgi:tRNA threonylcarbamoyladenosine biosynthesis protein TsaE